MKAQPILIIEDEHALGSALSLLVRRMGHLPKLVATGAQGLNEIEKSTFAAVVLDIGLPDINGLTLLEKLRVSGNETPVLVITAHATLDHAIHSQKSGATDYLTKPLDMNQFEQSLLAMMTPFQERGGETSLENESESHSLIGSSPCLRETFLGIARACTADVPVMIVGPSGSGKSLAAKVIHMQGDRSGEPMIEHACAQLDAASLLDADATGTHVLDEITELDLKLQAKLAEQLSGASDTGRRFIATTSRHLQDAVKAGELREDLYYALSALTIPMPRLADRSGDIPALCSFFAGLRGEQAAGQITPPAMQAMQAYEWPGNVRELRHALDYALEMSHGRPVFLSHLPVHIAEAGDAMESRFSSGEMDLMISRWLDEALSRSGDQQVGYDELLDCVESSMLKHLLERFEHRPTRLAAELGMNRATLRQKLKRLGLQRDDK